MVQYLWDTATNWVPMFLTVLGIFVAVVAACYARKQYKLAKDQTKASQTSAKAAQDASKTANEHRETTARHLEKIGQMMEKRVALSEPSNVDFGSVSRTPRELFRQRIAITGIVNKGDIPIEINLLDVEGFMHNAGTPNGLWVSFGSACGAKITDDLSGREGDWSAANPLTVVPGKILHLLLTCERREHFEKIEKAKILLSCDPPLTLNPDQEHVIKVP